MSSKRTIETLSDSDDQDSPTKKRVRPFSSEQSSSLANEFKQAFNNESVTKKLTQSESDTGDIASKMMRKMGYKEGTGLGRHSQGIVAPIEESNQLGRKGLGFGDKNFAKRVGYWDESTDPVTHIETPLWLENLEKETPSLKVLKGWKVVGSKKRTLDDEYQFCSQSTLQKVLECKSIFDNLEDKEMRNARSRANPFERIGAQFFQNRAALKMANIDAVFDFMFTDPHRSDGSSKVEQDEPLYFCDVCAGPGGFSEYVLWRKKWKTKGFGFTLKAENDFKLEEFLAGSPELFEPHYGINGPNGDGDVTKTKNLKEFQKFIVDQTNHAGVHFMMADGGFSVEGNENIQEILSKQLYLCQFLCALSVLRLGGNFVCKLFDLFTPFSVGLVYLMYLCFERICIHKPVTSRPANSERYIICEGAKDSKNLICDYLFDINETLNKTFRDETCSYDVETIVPISVLKNDEEFYKYIFNSNETIGITQCLNLTKIQAFATNRNLRDSRQGQLIEDCLQYWKLPNQKRLIYADKKQLDQLKDRNEKFRTKVVPPEPDFKKTLDKLDNELRSSKLQWDLSSFAKAHIKELTKSSINENFKKSSIYDYKCALTCGTLVLLIGCGRNVVYELELNSPINLNSERTKQWKKLENFNIELPKDTLLLAEKVVEYRGFEKGQQKFNAIHIIDALFIQGEMMLIDNNKIENFEERHSRLKIFVKAIQKKSRVDLNTIRLKDLFNIDDIESTIVENLVAKSGKYNSKSKQAIHIPLYFASEFYVYPTGVYFLKSIQSPWSIVKSKSTGNKYYYRADKNQSTYSVPNDPWLFASPKSFYENGLVWIWNEDEVNDPLDSFDAQNEILTKDYFIDFLRNFVGN